MERRHELHQQEQEELEEAVFGCQEIRLMCCCVLLEDATLRQTLTLKDSLMMCV